jgi:hypothetical protein
VVRSFCLVEVIETESAERIEFQAVFLYGVVTGLAKTISSNLDLFESCIYLGKEFAEIVI